MSENEMKGINKTLNPGKDMIEHAISAFSVGKPKVEDKNLKPINTDALIAAAQTNLKEALQKQK